MIWTMIRKIVSLLGRKKEGLSFQKIAKELHLLPKEKILLKRRLKQLEEEGLILRISKRYFIRPRSKTIQGKLVTALSGFGFVRPEGNFLEDIFIPARYSAGAVQGDSVEVLCLERGSKRKPEGRIIRILKKGKKNILGVYKERGGQSFFLPFDSPSLDEVPLVCDRDRSLKSGLVVSVDRSTMRLKEILGKPEDQGVDTRVVIQKFDLATSFSEEALAEAGKITSEIKSQDKKDRVDYREWSIITIDGASAQDFDDAVSIKKLKNGNYLLGVHIADVSHYVTPGTPLDKDAYHRGTSVYFPGMTLPMLPERLSNDICSLRPREDRLTISVLLEIDGGGNVLSVEIYPSLIRPRERMTYDSVYKIFDGDKEEKERFSALIPDLLIMRDLAGLLREKRVKAGSLDFDLSEPELVYREGNLYSVVPLAQNEAHQVIEEFMLVANETVASYLIAKEVPLLFRIHPPPTLDRIAKLREILAHFDFSFSTRNRIRSQDLQFLLRQAEGKPEEKFIVLQVLKSLKLAVYSDENEGHYGLAKKEYTHFTSPIRRYPDLVVHRILKATLENRKIETISLSAVAQHCSEQERKADEAERNLMQWRILRFLKGKLGEEFEGIIIGVSQAGVFVELIDYFVDGIIPFSDFRGDYFFKKRAKMLVDKKTGRTFELGDRMKVILASVDPLLRRIGLAL